MSVLRPTIERMLPLGPTSHAVAAAIAHYRQLRELTIDELSYSLSTNSYDLAADDLPGIEQGLQVITVDDVIALAVALGVTPLELLCHIPIDHVGEGPLATALPGDVDQSQLRAWMQGRTTLDHPSRVQWAQDRVARLQILSTHHDDQLAGARDELTELGVLAEREAYALPVIRLHERIRENEYAVQQADLALAYAERRLELLQGVDR